MYWYPASFELDYPSVAVDFESWDEAIRLSSTVHYVADDGIWLVGGAGRYVTDSPHHTRFWHEQNKTSCHQQSISVVGSGISSVITNSATVVTVGTTVLISSHNPNGKSAQDQLLRESCY